MRKFRLGKLPARKGATKFKFDQFFSIENLPTPPATFGTYKELDDWPIFANDTYGDCVFAGAGHEHISWNYEGQKTAQFTTNAILKAYSDVTGFNVNDPTTDLGTDMEAAASYRRKTGIKDTVGKYHKVDAYVELKLGSFEQLKVAMYLFGAVGIGFLFPTSAWDQFEFGVPWDVPTTGYPIDGGHYVAGIGINEKGNIVCVTWGKEHEMTPAFYEKYADEVLAYIELDRLKGTLSPEGFDSAKLEEFLLQLKKNDGYFAKLEAGALSWWEKLLAWLKSLFSWLN